MKRHLAIAASVKAAIKEREAQIDQIWQDSGNDPRLFDLMLRREDTEHFLAQLRRDHSSRPGIERDLAVLVLGIETFGEPVNDIDRRNNRPRVGDYAGSATVGQTTDISKAA